MLFFLVCVIPLKDLLLKNMSFLKTFSTLFNTLRWLLQVIIDTDLFPILKQFVVSSVVWRPSAGRNVFIIPVDVSRALKLPAWFLRRISKNCICIQTCSKVVSLIRNTTGYGAVCFVDCYYVCSEETQPCLR